MDPTIAQTLSRISQPARPVTPTPGAAPDALDDMLLSLYGPAAVKQPEPLPAWLPPNVQNSIRSQPSYAENQAQPSGRFTDEPPTQPPNPQIDDIYRLFSGSRHLNAPTSQQLDARRLLPQLMKLPNFAGFTGGDEI